MSLDKFVVSVLFDDRATADSIKKIEQIIDKSVKFIKNAFVTLGEGEFLRRAIDSTVKLATQLDNLSYATNANAEDLNAWGEAAKRNGGSVEGFYSSISNLSTKIIDMQTSFGSAGQLVFARLGLNLRKSNGDIKTSIDLLSEIGQKFKDMPKVWQISLGRQLGLDQGTIRLISSGSKEALNLVEKMRQLGGVHELNTEKVIRFRNSLYDLELVWQNIKLTIGNAIIPLLTKFTELLVKSFRLMQEHATLAKFLLVSIAAIISGQIVRSIYLLASAILLRLVPALKRIGLAAPELIVMSAALLAIGLLVEDFVVYLQGGNSAFKEYYDWIGKVTDKLSFLGKALHFLRHGFEINSDDIKKAKVESDKVEEGHKNIVKDAIFSAAIKLGYDPKSALTIARLENDSLDPYAENPSKGTAAGVFQLTDDTFNDAKKKFDKDDKALAGGKYDIFTNTLAGLVNLKNTHKELSKYFGRESTGAEDYIGENFGVTGSKKVFSAAKDTPLKNLLSPKVFESNSQYRNLTAGQVQSQLTNAYNQKSVSIGNITINAPNSNAKDIAKHVGIQVQKHLTSIVTNSDNGVKQ